jgi:ribosome modulation factor
MARLRSGYVTATELSTMAICELTTPYKQGQQAYIDGRSVSSNPYHQFRLSFATEWKEWRDGWIQEQDDRIEIAQHMLG